MDVQAPEEASSLIESFSVQTRSSFLNLSFFGGTILACLDPDQNLTTKFKSGSGSGSETPELVKFVPENLPVPYSTNSTFAIKKPIPLQGYRTFGKIGSGIHHSRTARMLGGV
jgi:hypothetical protein